MSYPGILVKSNFNELQTSLKSSLDLCSNKSLCQGSSYAKSFQVPKPGGVLVKAVLVSVRAQSPADPSFMRERVNAIFLSLWSYTSLFTRRCWNSKRRQPDTSTSVDLYIDGFSCHYQLMPSAGMFIPVIPFHYHMILFSNSPLFSLPSFLHDSLTMQFHTFPVPLYLVIFVSCPSDVVPHSSATSEVSHFIHMMLHPISY